MTDEKKPDNLEMAKIKLERFKEWRKIITVAITVLFGSVIVALINYSIQDRQLEQQKLLNEKELKLQKEKAEADIALQKAKAESERRQAEMEYLGDFITFALEDDYKKRLRFADYFAALSTELKTNWESYRDRIIRKQEEFEVTKTLLAEAKEKKDVENVEKLTTKYIQQKAQLGSLRSKAVVSMTFDQSKRFLDESGRPRKYTDNDFKVQNGGKLVVDDATGLTWQQSGSEHMYYDKAKMYIKQLNRNKYAGYNDWRLPKLTEAITLLEQEKNSDGLFIGPGFDKKQKYIWTSDLSGASGAWVVYFNSGVCSSGGFFDVDYYVRAVR